MFSQKNVIDFAMWWYGPASDSCFKGQANVTVEQGFEYWNKNVYAAETLAQAENKLKAEICEWCDGRNQTVKLVGKGYYKFCPMCGRKLSAV